MTAKEYLNRLRRIAAQRDNKKKQLDKLRESKLYLRGISYDTDRVQTSPRDSMSEAVAKIVDLEREVEEAILEYDRLYNDCIDKINSLSKREYIAILHSRYVERKKFEEISCDIGYSYYRTCRMHGEALDEFEKKFLRK